MIYAVGFAVAACVMLLAAFVARDMDRRGRDGQLYAIAVLFVLPLGLLMWGLDRRRAAPPKRTSRFPPLHSRLVDLGIAARTALVTASSKGLGRASAMALAAEGVNVTICARDGDTLAQTARAIEALGGGQVHAVVTDITHRDAPARLVAETVERFGALHIIVANAGGPPAGRALAVDDNAIVAAIEANLLSTVRLVREGLPHLRAAGWGRIVAIESISVKQPIGDLALSNLARTGLWAWAKTAAQDIAADNITLNLACPGLHATDRVKQLGHTGGRLGDPGDFGKVVAFLCSAPAGFINGSAVGVDGGAVTGLL